MNEAVNEGVRLGLVWFAASVIFLGLWLFSATVLARIIQRIIPKKFMEMAEAAKVRKRLKRWGV